jgi:hypothetical protein
MPTLLTRGAGTAFNFGHTLGGGGGGGGGGATNTWSNSNTDPIVAWTDSAATTTIHFAIISNGGDNSTSNPWQYASSPYTSWTSFPSPATVYHAISGGIYWNGILYSGYAISPQWSKGNPGYHQQIYSGTFNSYYTSNETTAQANLLWTGVKYNS